MRNIRQKVKKEIEKIWPQAEKNLTRLSKDAAKLMKKTEKNIVEMYAEAKKQTQNVVRKAQREKLYYELGRIVSPLLTSDQLNNKNVLRLHQEIRQLNKKLRKKT